MNANKETTSTTTTDTAASIESSTGVPDSNSEDACVVCFKNVDIYSIGECDHPVCHECSTRMRVLCQQNECPICRQALSKVIFTYNKLPYRELEAKNRSEYYSKRYKIGFYDNKIQQVFFDLLDHPCPKCNAKPYRTFQGLQNHVRKEHDLHYCDICTEHLRIFTFERRSYTQAEMGLHRTKGDADNRSHRGHPLCEYCNKRYLDRDELFRHLRREHYFCHFCDANGCNEFYRNYEALAEHFRTDHFLCEEGKCATDQFVGAFNTEIDYKAHVANVHGKLLNKQQAKQTRTLQLEITLGPRGRKNETDQGIASLRSRGNEDPDDDSFDATIFQTMHPNQRSITIDSRNEQDFPSLAGAAGGPSVSLTRPPPQSMRNRSATAGLARTKENFPALGSGGLGTGTMNTQRSQAAPISSILRKTPTTATGAVARTTTTSSTGNSNNSGAGMVIHVSNRPTSNTSSSGAIATSKKQPQLDFPALPTSKTSKKQFIRSLEEDMPPAQTNIPLTNVSSKHRTLIDDYVSVANPSNFQKIQMVQKEEMEAKARKIAELANAPNLTSEDFPTLGGATGVAKGSTTVSVSSWSKVSDKKQRELENRKAKIAPAPLLPKDNKPQTTNSRFTSTNNNHSNQAAALEASAKKDKKKEKKNVAAESSNNQSNKINGKQKEKNNNSSISFKENKSTVSNLNNVSSAAAVGATMPLVNGNDASSSLILRPPPGFANQQANSVKPPPGFHSNVTVNSVAKSPNSLTFTSSLGESYSIVPTHTYAQPPEAIMRNMKLVDHFNEALKAPEALKEFRYISQKFREGLYKTNAYYEHCQAALQDKFDQIFPELLALLPDINKQQALYLVHTQRLNTMSSSQRKSLPKLEVCSTCKQVLLNNDLENHKKLHALKENFPTLSAVNAVAKNSNSTRK